MISDAACAEFASSFRAMERGRSLQIDEPLRLHIASCADCWSVSNRLKWWLADDSEDIQELRDFLGNDFEEAVDASRALAALWNETEPSAPADVAKFYEENPWYIYNLTLWEASGRRPAYVDRAWPLLQRYAARTIVDVGAGVGNDSLKFAARGCSVIAVEYDNLSSQFLRWRARRRGLDELISIVNPGEVTEAAIDAVCPRAR